MKIGERYHWLKDSPRYSCIVEIISGDGLAKCIVQIATDNKFGNLLYFGYANYSKNDFTLLKNQNT